MWQAIPQSNAQTKAKPTIIPTSAALAALLFRSISGTTAITIPHQNITERERKRAQKRTLKVQHFWYSQTYAFQQMSVAWSSWRVTWLENADSRVRLPHAIGAKMDHDILKSESLLGEYQKYCTLSVRLLGELRWRERGVYREDRQQKYTRKEDHLQVEKSTNWEYSKDGTSYS